MGVTYTIDGSTVTTITLDSVELVESADAGAVGEGRLTIDDPAGTIDTVGYKTVAATEDDCSDPNIGVGFVGHRTIRRGTRKTGAGRQIDVAVRDLNDLLGRRVIKKADGKRPSESIGARLRWLLASDYLSGLVYDNGFVDYPSTIVDKTDLTNSRPGDVIADLATQGDGRQFFVYRDPSSGQASLWFRDSATSTDFSSTLRISNDLADIDWTTTFEASQQMTLERDPDPVFSGAAVPYSRGTVFERKASTATAFVERDGVAPTSSIRTAAKASRVARRFLNDHDHEADVVNDSVLLPSSKAGLVHAGMRLQAKYTHTVPEGYSSFTWYRILERRLSHVVSPGGIPSSPGEPLYRLNLRMVPQEGSAPAACPYGFTATADYYPLGGWYDAEDGNIHSTTDADGVVYYLRPGMYYPIVPTPGYDDFPGWHFRELGVGGAGSIDYAGDCVQNTLQFIVVGPGTMTVQTEAYSSGTRPMAAYWFGDVTAGSMDGITSGDSVEIDLTSSTCVSVVRFIDGTGSPCGGKWGWSTMHWEAA